MYVRSFSIGFECMCFGYATFIFNCFGDAHFRFEVVFSAMPLFGYARSAMFFSFYNCFRLCPFSLKLFSAMPTFFLKLFFGYALLRQCPLMDFSCVHSPAPVRQSLKCDCRRLVPFPCFRGICTDPRQLL